MQKRSSPRKPISRDYFIAECSSASNKRKQNETQIKSKSTHKKVKSDNMQNTVKQKDTKQIDTKQTDTKKIDTKQIDTKQIDTKQTDTKQDDSKQIDTEQDDSKQTNTKQTDTKQDDSKQTNTKQTDTKQDDSKQKDNKQKSTNKSTYQNKQALCLAERTIPNGYIKYDETHACHRILPTGTRIRTKVLSYSGCRDQMYYATIAKDMVDYSTTLFVIYDDDTAENDSKPIEYQIRRDQINAFKQ